MRSLKHAMQLKIRFTGNSGWFWSRGGCVNGAPGLYSARYAGVDGDEADAKNREKLLAELVDVPSERRQAKFVSTIVLLQHPSDPSPIIAQGECDGQIIYEEKGENGFGYDSLFF